MIFWRISEFKRPRKKVKYLRQENQGETSAKLPQLEEDLYFSLIGRKKLFTAGRVGSLLPPGRDAQKTGSALKKGDT